MSITNTSCSQRMPERTCWTHLVLLLLIMAIIRLWLASTLQLVPDEAYYWSWARQLSFCYYDQPGMIAFIEYLFVQLPGFSSAFMARLPFVLMGLMASVVMYLLSRDLFGSSRNAFYAVLFFNLTPLFWCGSIMLVHDGALIFFWLLALWLFNLFIKKKKRLFLYLSAISITAAMYSKFTGCFLIVGVFLFLLLSSEQRQLFRRFDFYACCLIVAVLFLPVILWNSNNDWIAYHAVQKLGQRDAITFAKRLEYFFAYHGSLLGILSPLFFLSLIMCLARSVIEWAKTKSDTLLLCLCFSLPSLVYFSWLNMNTRSQPNWSAIAWPVVYMLMVELTGRLQRQKRGFSQAFSMTGYWWTALTIAVFTSLLVCLQAAFQIIPLPPEMARKDRLCRELCGWQELGAHVGDMRQNHETIMALRYQIAAELEFYVPGQPQVYCLNAFGRGNHYDFRNDYAALDAQTILIVSEKPIPPELAGKFNTLDGPFRFEVKNRDLIIKSFLIYRGHNFNAFNGPILDRKKHI